MKRVTLWIALVTLGLWMFVAGVTLYLTVDGMDGQIGALWLMSFIGLLLSAAMVTESRRA